MDLIRRVFFRIVTSRAAEVWAIAGIMAGAALLRVYRLGVWSFWIDEAFTVGLQEDGFNYSLLRRSLANDLIQWVIGRMGLNEWNARLVPAMIGIVSIPLIYLLLRKAVGRPAAITAVGLLALAPWHLYWSQNARFYSLLFLFYNLGLLAFFLALEEDRGWLMVLALALFGMAARERLVALFFAPVAIVYLGLLRLLHLPLPSGAHWKRLALFFAPGAIAGAVFVIPYLKNWQGWLEGFGFSNNSPLWIVGGTLGYIGLPVAIFAAAAGFFGIRRKERAALLFSVGAVLPLLMLAGLAPFHYTANRFIFFSLMSWISLAGMGVNYLRRSLSGQALILAAGVGLLLAGAYVGEDFLYFRYQNGNREDWRAAFAYIQTHTEPGEWVVVSDLPIAGVYGVQKPIPYSHWKPGDVPAGGGVWLVEDTSVAKRYPEHLAWMEAHAQLEAVFDYSFQARRLTMRVWRVDKQIIE